MPLKVRPWYVTPDPASAPRRALRASRARRDESRATSARVVIVSSLFLVVLTSALLVGGHAAIEPLLQSAMAARDPQGTGDVVYRMPDGIYCRHMSFDNMTAEITEGGVERCPDNIADDRARTAKSFAWGGR
jgi:hypothetical protein